ncbi:MAG: glycosyltransferase [Kaiparowitsia implicata GSE-PSE-MK54-09C]|jgi:hypothetical protein|nr:glycosyltransferase [Kaiparowitsia implicata GSE-PSE-MK54-09C]
MVKQDTFIKLLSQKNLDLGFQLEYATRLQAENPQNIALMITTEFEGIYRNGGIGTYYRTLSEHLAEQGWYVILLVCNSQQDFEGESDIPCLKHIFGVGELPRVLNLQPIHESILKAASYYSFVDRDGYSSLFFVQAIENLFPASKIYVEFHEMNGLAARTILAKKCGILDQNVAVAVTMHSGHEWIYEANEWFAEEYQNMFLELINFEQFSFENADLAFFPSYHLRSRVDAYGWDVSESIHMPYFIPILEDNSKALEALEALESSSPISVLS